MTESRGANFGKNMTKNFLHQQTLTLELDQEMITTNMTEFIIYKGH